MTGFVDVALPLPLFPSFTYRYDGDMPAPGSRVLVPFRRSEQVGWIVGPAEDEGRKGIRPVLDLLDRPARPSLPRDLLQLGHWISEYYAAPLGIALRTMLPSVLSDGATDVLRVPEVVPPEADPGDLSAPARRLLDAVHGAGGAAGVSAVRSAVGRGSPWPAIRELTRQGFLEHMSIPPSLPVKTHRVVRISEWVEDLASRERLFGRARRQRECYELLERRGGSGEAIKLQKEDGFSPSVLSGLVEKGLVRIEDEEVMRDPFLGRPASKKDHEPTPAQADAVRRIMDAMSGEPPRPFLLHGVTGSGKTLVYIRVLRDVVENRGKGAIVLVPEIALTPQTVSRFRAWFGDEVAVLHSGLSDGERFDQWRQIRDGAKRVVVGARSALFAPVRDLGVIVVDEEHDGSYKQSEAPRYHARDVAVVRAKLAGAICVLGTATPSLETWANAASGKFIRVSLPERVGGGRLPPVEVVDLRAVRASATGGSGRRSVEAGVLSPTLVDAVRACLARKEQAILLLNRRGYSSFVQCRTCGDVRKCPNCSVSLTFHRARGRLVCHHCRHEEGSPDRCTACGDTDLSRKGLGTEQVERVVGETFPDARVARMDVDTTSGRWAHEEILGRVGRGEVDILLGTQMIAKGLDFRTVTVVGVVNADTGIHLPDFRACERTFQLLSQVAGRAGRGSLGGRVIIQTSLPDHYAVQSAVNHDSVGFLERELVERQRPAYPPHVRLVNIVVSSPDPRSAAGAVDAAVAWIRAHLPEAGDRSELVGPAPAPIERLHNRWRWHFFLRGGRVGAVTTLLRRFAEEFRPRESDVRVAVDRDPTALL